MYAEAATKDEADKLAVAVGVVVDPGREAAEREDDTRDRRREVDRVIDEVVPGRAKRRVTRRGERAWTRAADLAEVEAQRGRDAEASNTTATRRKRLQDALENGLHDALTTRQQDALHAATSCNTMRAAARTCGMQPRDFRRSIGAISRRARALQDREPIADRVLPGCEPGMAV